MIEKDPRVIPFIRLPQLPPEAHTAQEAPPETKQAPLPPLPLPPPDDLGEDELDDELEKEEPSPRPLRTEISGEQARLSRETSGLRVPASGVLKRALLNFAEQDRHRSRLLVLLLVAQAVVWMLLLPGYLLGQRQLMGVLLVVAGLALFGGVWLCNRLGRIWEACYLLVIGGGVLVVAAMLLSAAHLLSLETLHISLLFLLVILAAGILFSPETALVFALLSASFTAIVFLVFPLSSPLEIVFAAQGRYFSLSMLVVAQLGVGVVAWLFGRRMQESVHIVTYLAGMEMSNKRLRQRLRLATEKKRNLEGGIAIIQQTHARVAAGDYSARARVEGDLLPLAVSLNLMLERVESFVDGEYERERMETAVAGLAELAGRVGQGNSGHLPALTGTALDGLSIAIKQMQTDVNQRLARVQQSAAALLTTVGHCEEHLLPVAEALEEHLRSVDALVLAADNVMTSAQRQSEYAARAEALLRSAAPPGITLAPPEAENPRKPGTSALRLADEVEERRAAGAALWQGLVASPQGAVQAAPTSWLVPEVPAVEQAAPTVSEASTTAEEPATEAIAAKEPAELEELPATEVQEASPPATEPGPELSVPTEGADALPTGEVSPADALTVEEETAQPETPEAALAEPASEAAPGEPAGEGTPAGSEHAGPLEQASTEGEAAPPDTPEVEVVEQTEPEAVQPEAPNTVAAELPARITLAEVDREAAEEAAQEVPGWRVDHLQALADVLSTMAGEATQQERNARTLNYKLRAMLQGMPTTRRVDITAAWLHAALGAISRSANQVRQASQALPAKAFTPAAVPGEERER